MCDAIREVEGTDVLLIMHNVISHGGQAASPPLEAGFLLPSLKTHEEPAGKWEPDGKSSARTNKVSVVKLQLQTMTRVEKKGSVVALLAEGYGFDGCVIGLPNQDRY
ncbi:hypothetical protein P4O66_003105 [Electrophorus voltai]|uniref:Uncharacterized protein n=1 Tax=Electrophorus voltai TaxID=2609070 RepID=A0AAD9DL50_9TELE|nr:hypothetical protein P4O66_003105 [Electrophorus voltai]